jgi:AcrR family transcriptional regulator
MTDADTLRKAHHRRRGRPPRHTLDQIVTAAVALADAEGLPGATMRAVASRLGTAVMSLYSYVPDKQTLIRAMVEHVSEEYLQLPEPSGDWRADVHLLAHRQRELAHRHPWLVDATTPTPPLGPGTLAYLEFALGALEPTGLDARARLETTVLITGFVASLVRSELDRQAASRQRAAEAARLNQLLATGRYPRFAAAVGATRTQRGSTDTDTDTDTDADTDTDTDTEFGRLLDRLLDGLVPQH